MLIGITGILTYALVIFLLLFVSLFIDYDALLSATNDQNVNFWTDIIDPPNEFHPLFIFFGLLGLYLIFKIMVFCREIPLFLEVKHFYEEHLKITEQELQNIPWEKVVSRVITVPGLCRANENWNELDVANRIMRQENYFIALINFEIFDFQLWIFKWIPTGNQNVAFHFASDLLGWVVQLILTRTLWKRSGPNTLPTELEENVRRAKFDPGASCAASDRLTFLFRVYGAIALILLPFTLVYMTARYLFEYGNEFRSNPSNLGSRMWSPLARWRFREINELNHVFQKRLRQGELPATEYLDQFRLHWTNIAARFATFTIGSLIVVLLFFSLFSDNLLTSVNFAPDKSGIWVLGLLGIALAFCQSFTFSDDFCFDPDGALQRVCGYTHYSPAHWREKAHTLQVKTEFGQLFSNRGTVLMFELASVIVVPLILLFRLPNCSDRIVQFYSSHTKLDPILGDICSFGAFADALEKSNECKENTTTTTSSHNNPSVPSFIEEEGGGGDISASMNEGKLEKSFIFFAQEYPNWKCPPVGEQLLDNLVAHVVQEKSLQNSLSLSNSTSSPPFVLPQALIRNQRDNNYFFDSSTQSPPIHLSGLSTERSDRNNQNVMLFDIQESYFRARNRGSPHHEHQ
jgi:autophagy-related protein 9